MRQTVNQKFHLLVLDPLSLPLGVDSLGLSCELLGDLVNIYLLLLTSGLFYILGILNVCQIESFADVLLNDLTRHTAAAHLLHGQGISLPLLLDFKYLFPPDLFHVTD